MKNQSIRKHFPILKEITYFDSAALVLKPKIAADAIYDFYTKTSISSRTADTPLGNLVNQKIETVRKKVADLLDAKSEEIIFTSGTTESINLFVNMLAQLLTPNDIILLDTHNHSSNMIPWIEIAKKTHSKILISDDILKDINLHNNIKIIAFAQENNTFYKNYDLNKIKDIATAKNILIFNDAAQAICHQKVSLQICDVIVFSTNKFYGPTGMGVLAVQKTLLKQLKPVKFGGGSVNEIKINGEWSLKQTIAAFEPGTPDLAGFFMFDKAIDFFNSIGYQKTKYILQKLSIYLHQRLSELPNITIASKPGDYIALINVKGINAQDVAGYLGKKNIYTIAGIFCTPYLRNIDYEYSYLRISLGIYNNFEDIDKLIDALANGGDFYGF
ncbi:cysteine desulfurase/selenocysteine lyase [Mycoplasmopsis mustelae]|uniref:Cysteine desulfurase/selenocysteine lyase n=1 Tax=Mycoplasmopsis mustelae TaxID=171289 RepID=A0A4R7UBX3_9BACT|nr:aminotransferase class V-fold PLP-dependent enzyme [Mycoplasmopsis mustelae]TDV23040.1 cysteine desulfurase/selenocysteine lyase [Mycoplasmopsis mustelae]